MGENRVVERVHFARGCHYKIPWTAWSKQREFIFSLFWKLEIHDQGDQGVSFWLFDSVFSQCLHADLHLLCLGPHFLL